MSTKGSSSSSSKMKSPADLHAEGRGSRQRGSVRGRQLQQGCHQEGFPPSGREGRTVPSLQPLESCLLRVMMMMMMMMMRLALNLYLCTIQYGAIALQSMSSGPTKPH
jgi:hypothetical protein